MSDELLDLARRAVACPAWHWLPGMVALPTPGMMAHPIRLCDDRRASYPNEYDWPHDLGLRLPDLTDPATLGCVMALIREEWGQPAGIAALVAALEAHHA